MPSRRRDLSSAVLDLGSFEQGVRLAAIPGERQMAGAKFLELSRIKPNPNQPRKHFDAETLEELAESIRRRGVLQPIVVRPEADHYLIVMGERRYRASLLAGLEEIPALVREMSDEEVFLAALTENLQRANLDPSDEAEAYQGLVTKGYSVRSIAEQLSISPARISKAVRIHQDPVLSEAVSNKVLSKAQAQELLVAPKDEVPRLVQFVANKRRENQRITSDQLRSEVARLRQPLSEDGHESTAGVSGRNTPQTSGYNAAVLGRNTNSTRAEIESLREHFAMIRSILEGHPILAWDPEISHERAVVETVARRVSGQPCRDTTPEIEVTLNRLEVAEGIIRVALGCRAEPAVARQLDRLRALLDETFEEEQQ